MTLPCIQSKVYQNTLRFTSTTERSISLIQQRVTWNASELLGSVEFSSFSCIAHISSNKYNSFPSSTTLFAILVKIWLLSVNYTKSCLPPDIVYIDKSIIGFCYGNRDVHICGPVREVARTARSYELTKLRVTIRCDCIFPKSSKIWRLASFICRTELKNGKSNRYGQRGVLHMRPLLKLVELSWVE